MATLLKDTEAVMAFLEAKLRDEKKSASGQRPGSISPESDVDTASTASQVAVEADRKAAQKRRSLSSLHREKSSMSSTAKTSTPSASARERLERKTKTRTDAARPDARRSVQPGSSTRGRQPSLDLTDDDQTSFPISEDRKSVV